MRHYYGFAYEDGVNTTRGPRYITAGQLYEFVTAIARNTWVDDGYPHCVPRDWGEIRVKVTARCLPHGWTTDDAIRGEDYFCEYE
jgi:hypothetical protein